MTNRHFTGVLIGGLIAAVLDIIYAIILTLRAGHTAIGTLQAIASGLVGVEAFQGGIAADGLSFTMRSPRSEDRSRRWSHGLAAPWFRATIG